jgi:hypothetical protein
MRTREHLVLARGDRGWLPRGALAGGVVMIVAVLPAVALVTAVVGDAGPGWAEQRTFTGVAFTALWALAAAGAGAIGAWQAAEGGAPSRAAARLAGALGPALLILVVSVASLGGDGASSAAIVAQAVVEIAAAVAGATALARRLESG